LYKNSTDPVGLFKQQFMIEQLSRYFYRFSMKGKFNLKQQLYI
jgi:hypothetical protein